MAKTDANPPLPRFPGDYVLQEIAPDDLSRSVKPKQFLHIDQSECIMCEGCVDICPWKCIHMLGVDSIEGSANTVAPGIDPPVPPTRRATPVRSCRWMGATKPAWDP